MGTLKTLEGLRVDFIVGTLDIGGTERQLYYMAKALSGAGARIRILSLTLGGLYEKRIGELGIPIIYVGMFPSKAVRLYNIICEVKKDRPQIIHSAHFYTNLYVAIAARIVGTKEVGTIRLDLLQKVGYAPFLKRWCLRSPRFLIANSRQAINNAHYFGMRAESIYLFENVVDTELFQPAGDKIKNLGDSNSTTCIICVGRFVEEKRIDLFLHILSAVHQKAPGIRAKIVGNGPLKSWLEDLSRRLCLGPDTVEFTGIVEDMPAIYQQADILVLTSDYEGMPNVVLEAMACGLPVVATSTGAVPDMVEHGVTGYVVPTNDNEGLIQYILALVHNPALRRKMGLQARALVERRFSSKALQKRLLLLYGSVLASK